MRLGKYIPDYEDCIDIPLTKHTWVWVQNNTYYEFDDKVTDFCVELHNDSDHETMVASDFLSLIGNESKKDIIETAIDKALEVLPQMFYSEVKENPDYAWHIWETLEDIYYSTKQNNKYGSLRHYIKQWRKAQ